MQAEFQHQTYAPAPGAALQAKAEAGVWAEARAELEALTEAVKAWRPIHGPAKLSFSTERENGVYVYIYTRHASDADAEHTIHGTSTTVMGAVNAARRELRRLQRAEAEAS